MYHNHMFGIIDDCIGDGHLFETGPNCSSRDFDFEDQCRVPFFGTAEFLFPLQEDVQGILNAAKALWEDHAGRKIGGSRE